MVNPGAFQGARKEFLMGEKAKYSIAVNEGYASDAVALIQRRFFKRFPIDLPVTEQPSAEALAAVDDNAPDPEPVEPCRENMTELEYKTAAAAASSRQTLLDFRKGQIKRWLAYQYMKDNDARPKETGAYNPYTILMQKLTGKETGCPRKRSAVNVWRKDKREIIESHLQGEIDVAKRFGKTITKDQYASMRDKIARDLFAKLPEEQRRSWLDQAVEEHRAAVDDYKAKMAGKPSTKPEDRQRGIQGLTQFMEPILDMACDVTGWKLTLLAGGPEPAQGGRLNVMSIHSGTTPGDIPMTFGRAERYRYKKEIVPIFGSFLQLCYSPEECRSRAIPDERAPLPMSSVETDSDGVTFHAIDNLQVDETPSAITSPSIPSTNSSEPSTVLHTSGTSVPKESVETAAVASITNTRDAVSMSPPPSPSNPFPFEDIEAPQSPIPSPPVSRPPSPIPTDSLLLINNLPTPPAIATAAATSTKKRKRDIPAVLSDIQPGSKRNRQMSTRAIEAEEHMGARKKGKSGVTGTKVKKAAGGKENRCPSQATQIPKGKKTTNKRRK